MSQDLVTLSAGQTDKHEAKDSACLLGLPLLQCHPEDKLRTWRSLWATFTGLEVPRAL